MIKARYFPCDEKYKKPIGGVEANTDFTIVFDLSLKADEVYFVLTKDEETPVWYLMRQSAEDGEWIKYTLTMQVTTPGLYFYYFVVRAFGEETCFYANADLTADYAGSEWQLTASQSIYKIPRCFEGGIIYQIMTDRFAIGGERVKSKPRSVYRDDWGGTPTFLPDERGIVRNADMFGGNLDGVREKLGYLKSLGVKCIYLNPIFEATSNHKYDTADYSKVDSDFGGEAALVRLLDEAKTIGISVILDGVFSHTGDDSIYFNKYGNYPSTGAYQSKDSPYYDWYDFQDFPNRYTAWWGINILPCVNETNASYNEFINGEDGIVRKYIKLGCAGWRLDVADELPDEFLDNLAAAAKRARPDAMVLGEVWEDASNKISYSRRRRYFGGKQLDSVTNYPLKDAIINYVLTHSTDMLKSVALTQLNNYPKSKLDNLMNVLSTHDTNRILTCLSGDSLPSDKRDRAEYKIKNYEQAKRNLKLASVLQYTLPGVPCVFYGDEAGMQGCEDPFCRRCYPWGSEDFGLIEHYRRLGKLRARTELQHGSFRIVKADGGVFEFVRDEKLAVAINLGNAEFVLPREVTELVSQKKMRSILPGEFAVFEVGEDNEADEDK